MSSRRDWRSSARRRSSGQSISAERGELKPVAQATLAHASRDRCDADAAAALRRICESIGRGRAIDVDALVRSLSPQPCARGEIAGVGAKIIATHPLETSVQQAPGTPSRIPHGLAVACGEGARRNRAHRSGKPFGDERRGVRSLTLRALMTSRELALSVVRDVFARERRRAQCARVVRLSCGALESRCSRPRVCGGARVRLDQSTPVSRLAARAVRRKARGGAAADDSRDLALGRVSGRAHGRTDACRR